MSAEHDRCLVWTDGSYMDLSGHGGWAWATQDGKQNAGAVSGAVSSEAMEMKAILEAVVNLPGSLLILCDHQGIVRNLNRIGPDLRTWVTGRNRSLAMSAYLRSFLEYSGKPAHRVPVDQGPQHRPHEPDGGPSGVRGSRFV